ncbi:hypothetical protein Tco_1507414 [Tanacetum coccineum]
MASLDHLLNPLFSIKECMTCGALYTRNCGCSKGSLEDKILVPKPPQNCATCGNPIDGLNCRSCAFVRKCLNEGWYTIYDENEILNTSKSSNHNTNIEEERRIAEDQAAKDRYWKIPICYDDDEDYTIAITPVLLTEEPVDSLIMEDEHLDTTPATESDEVIKSSVEELVLIPNESQGISNGVCDVPLCDNPTPLKAFKDHSEIVVNSNNDDTSSNDDDFEDIEYVEASPPDLEIDSLEEVNEDQEEKEFDLEDIFQIQDVILREKLLNINRLISNIESLKDNPTLDCVLNSPSSFPIPIVDSDSFFEESDTSLSHLDSSIPEIETSSDHTEETRSDSTNTHANYSLPGYDSFLFEIEPNQGRLISIAISNNSTNDPLLELPEFESFHFDPSFLRPPPEPPDVEICLHFKPDAPVIDNFNEDQRGSEIYFSQNVEDDDSFTFVIRTFLPFLTYPEVSPLSCSTGNEDTIFDPDIST